MKVGRLVVVYRKKPKPHVYIRALRYDVFFPSDAQRYMRALFGLAAKACKKYGITGVIYDPELGRPLPAAAYLVRKVMKGKKAPINMRRIKTPKWYELVAKNLISMYETYKALQLRKTLLALLKYK